MGKIGKCCCGGCPTLGELPDIVLTGMTPTSDWTNFGGNTCCWQRTYTYNTTPDFELIHEDVIEEFSSDVTSVVEWLKYKQTPWLSYKLGTVPCYGGECLEPCPEGEAQPDPYDCGTYVKVATTTTRTIVESKTRHRFYIKKRDVIVQITKGNVSCDSDVEEKWVVSIRYRFWSRLGISQWGGAFGYLSTTRNTVFETCFSGGMPLGWGNTSSSSGSQSWGGEAALDTERMLVKTKTYATLPETDTWLASDPNTTDCYMLCSFAANSDASILLQAYVAPTYGSCSPTVSSQRILSGYVLNPCVLPSLSNCSHNTCVNCFDSPPTLSRVPGPTIDCSSRVYDRYYVSAFACSFTENVATISPTTASIEYSCGTCGSLTCDAIPDGWFQSQVGEACKYNTGGGAISSQVSFALTYVDVKKRDEVRYFWPALLVDFNL